jgi:hypothetical protein
MIYLIIIAIVIGLVMLASITYLQKKRSFVDRQFFIDRWDTIQKTYQNTPSKWMEVLIEADKLVDEALKQRGYSGKTMGERMVSANRIFKDPDMIWNAHKLRNRVVHETGIKVKKSHVSYALRGYRKALKDLEVI